MEAAPYRDVKASGIRLRVTDRGSGPTLLLLHTALLDRTCWAEVARWLGPQFRTVAPDLPGFGESEKPSQGRFAYSVDAFVEVVADLFAALQLGQACVVGHGLGGAIAVGLANRFPELVSRLVLVDALCYQPRLDPTRRLAQLPIVGSFVFKQLWGKRQFARHLRRKVLGPGSQVALERENHYFDAFKTPAARGSALATLRGTADTRAVRAALSRIAAPTLVVWGRNDALCSATFGQLMARQLRNSGFELLDTGHCPPEEAPERLAEVIRNFASALRAAG